MKRNCANCGREYEIASFRLDSTVCPDCTPRFLSLPAKTQGGTCSVWQFVVTMHVFYLLFCPLILDGGFLTIPAAIYSLTVLLYFTVRFGIAKFRGYPILTRLQQVGLLALPVYGPIGFIVLFYWVQWMRYGD